MIRILCSPKLPDILAEGFRALRQFLQGDARIEHSRPPTSLPSHHPQQSCHAGKRVLLRPGMDSRIKKGKVVPVLNILSTMPWRRMREWMYRPTFSWPRHYLEVSDKLHAPAALPPGEEPPDRMLSGPQNQSGRHGEMKTLDPNGTRTPTTLSSSQ
jgi:hypothetical protein